MSVSGVRPGEHDEPSVCVPKERLEAFDRLFAAGGINAIIESLENTKRKSDGVSGRVSRVAS